MALLAPEAPDYLQDIVGGTGLGIYSTTTFLAKKASDGSAHNNVATDTTPQFESSDFLDGDVGTLTASRSDDGGATYTVSGGSIDLTTGDET